MSRYALFCTIPVNGVADAICTSYCQSICADAGDCAYQFTDNAWTRTKCPLQDIWWVSHETWHGNIAHAAPIVLMPLSGHDNVQEHAYIAAALHMECDPLITGAGEVTFHSPVTIGSFLELSAKVCMVVVHAPPD